MRNFCYLAFCISCLLLPRTAFAESAAPPGPPAQRQHAPVDLRDADGDGLADGLQRRLQNLAPDEPVEVVVTLTRPAPRTEIENAVGAFALGRTFRLINGFSATVTAGQAQALAHLPFVFRVEPVYEVTALMEGSRADMGVDDVMGAYIDSPGTGAGIGICFVDSGIEVAHEAFNDGGVSKIAGYCNAIDSTTRTETCATGDVSTVEDDVGHGTEVAGVAAGDGTGSPYAVALHGIAPEAPIYVAKALQSGLYGATGNDIDVEAAVEWCAGQAGARVINLSVQGDLAESDGLDSMSRMVDAAVQAGKVVIAGTGNSDEPGTIRPPASAHLALAVGAYGEWSGAPEFIAAADALSSTEGTVARSALSNGPFIAPFSTRGNTSDGRIKPDLVTPGHTIATASANLLPSVLTCGNSCYDIVSGTSFSTPMLSGVAALILEANPSLTPDQVREILFSTARDRGYLDETTGLPIKDTNYGYGIVDAYAAVAKARALAGDSTLSTVPTEMPSNYLSARIWLEKEVDSNIDFTITPEQAASGVPLSVSMTGPLSGNLYCIFPTFCEYRPDIDIWLAKKVGGTYQVQWSSLCPGGQGTGQVDCGPYGLEEAITVPNPEAGDYRLIMRFLDVTGTPSNILYARALYEISWGPLAPPQRPAVANQPPEALASYSEDQGMVTLDASASSDPDGSVAFYTWFWDGGSAIGATPTVAFPDGTTPVTLTVVDDLDMTASTRIDVTVGAGPVNQPPVVDAGPDGVGEAGSTYASAGSFSDPDSTSWSATVDYGDGGGAQALALNPDHSFALSHDYADAGSYTITVAVDDGSASGQDTAQVTVNAPPAPNRPPLADAGDDQAVPLEGKGRDAVGFVTLDASRSTDPDGDALTFTWSDANGQLGTGESLDVQLAKGVYSITLTADDGEFQDTDTVCVEVYNKNPSGACASLNPAPTAAFSVSTSGLTASFTDASSDSDGTIQSWSWDFGDNQTSTEQNPVHPYQAAGSYTVSLSVTDNDGLTGSTSQTVMVSDATGGIALSASGYKVKGVQNVDLRWSGNSGDVDVSRDGVVIASGVGDGSYTDDIGAKGAGVYVYQVCQSDGTCSNEVNVTF